MEGEVDHEKDIVIVGGGICGLATALALHRKGIKSTVVERTETLRATGAAIIIHANGWRALDRLGIASKLSHAALPILPKVKCIDLDSGKCKEVIIGNGRMRCLRRSDLLEALAGDLPVNTIRYGSNVVSINLDQFTSRPLLHFGDGTTLLPKIVIGCDGVNSVVAKYLGMKAPRHFKTCVVRGFTRASRRDDKFQSQFVVTSKGNVQLGTMPVNHHLHYWFVTRPWTSQDSVILSDENLIKESTVKVLSILGFLQEDLDLVKKSDLHHLHLAPLRYQAPWELITGTRIRKGTVTVAGDAMHAMGPFIAQGGSASLEDAVILARCLALQLHPSTTNPATIVAATKLTMRLDWKNERKKVETAIDEYVKERKKRLIGLSTHAFLIGTRIDSSHTRSLWLRPIVKFMCVALLVIFFSDPCCHTRYDCGRL